MSTPLEVLAGWLLVGSLCLTGCQRAEKPPTPPPDHDPIRERLSDEDHLGWQTYLAYCVGCHGEAGDGQGPAAPFLSPRPRDFTRGIYKFTSTPAGQLPTDADLMRTLDRGLHGSAMPHFSLLSRAQKQALIEILKDFSPRFTEELPAATITFHANPFEIDPEFPEELEDAIRLGEEVYHAKAQCWSCHPIYAESERLAEIESTISVKIQRENPHLSVAKEDQWGEVIPPPDFRKDPMKSVRSLEDLYRVLGAGVGGTAMPSWNGVLTAEELWGLSYYVDSLVKEGRKQRAERLEALKLEAEKLEGSTSQP